MANPLESAEIYDTLGPFGGGMNSGVAAVLLPKNQLAFASNTTVRGTYARPRAPWQVVTLDFGDDPALEQAVTGGLWQGACRFKYDDGTQVIMAAISGRLFEFLPQDDGTAAVTERTGGNAQDASAPQHWMIQAEFYLIWNDGISLPVYYNSKSLITSRSVGQTAASSPSGSGYSALTTSGLVLQNNVVYTYNPLRVYQSGGPQTITLNLSKPYTGAAGDILSVCGTLTYGSKTAPLPVTIQVTVTSVGDPMAIIGTTSIDYRVSGYFSLSGPNTVTIMTGATVVALVAAPPANFTPQLPAGRNLAYIQGRVIEALTDGRSFLYGDIVGGPSGTKDNSFRDAVLFCKENAYIVGGGTFSVPGQFGGIRAFAESTVLDASLGQGPLLVLTPDHILSCAVPSDRTTWQSVTNPILTVALIGRSGTGQHSTVVVNSDTVFRQSDGIGSLILARRDFDTWGNVPISREMDRVLTRDDQSLLPYATAAFFDNRLLMSTSPASHAQGIYHRGLIALNTDPISSIQGKAPSVYDGSWPGLNALQLVTGEFDSRERCFAFTLDPDKGGIGLRELLPSSSLQVLDDGTERIVWWMESPVVLKDPENRKRTFKRLLDGEIYVDQMVGQVDFSVMYRPDDYPAWIPWISWSECAGIDTLTAAIAAANGTALPQFRPRMGLGEPSARAFDNVTNRPLREGYYFQVKIVIQGQCRFKGARFMAVPIPEPKFAPPSTKAVCVNPVAPAL